MKPIEELLRNLGRAEVLEFGLVTNRLPSVNIGGKFEPVDDEAPSTEQLLAMLTHMGGSKYVDQLSERPVQWTSRLDGVGLVAVAAIMRKDVVQARFTVARREVPSGRPSGPAPAQEPRLGPVPSTSAPAPALPSRPVPAKPAVAAASASGVVPVAAPAPAPSSPAVATAPPAPARSSSSPVVPAAASSSSPAVASPAAASSSPAAAPSSPALPAPPPPARPSSPKTRSPSSPHVVAAPPPARTGSTPSQKAAVAPSLGAAFATAPMGAQAAAAPPPAQPVAPAAQPAPPAPTANAEEWEDDDEPTVQTLSPPVAPPVGGASAPPGGVAGASAPPAGVSAPPAGVSAPPASSPDDPRPKPARRPEEVSGAPPAPAPAASGAPAAASSGVAAAAAAHSATSPPAASPAAASSAQPRTGVGRRITTPTSVDAVDVEVTASDPGSGAAVPADDEVDDEDNTLERKNAAAQATDRPSATSGLDSFLAAAIAVGASDLHVIAARPVMIRVAGELSARTDPVAPADVERMALDLVPSSLRDLLERDGTCTFVVDRGKQGRARVAVARQRTGYAIFMRLVPHAIPTLASAGLPPSLSTVVRYSMGLVLVTGPIGQGKTTTLAALVDVLNRETSQHILTIEDPLEFVHPRKQALISHREVGLHVRDIEAASRAVLREDANAIVIGEIRDLPTARLAVSAAESGHLVMATMCVPRVARAVDHLIEMFPASEQAQVRAVVASNIRLVTGQRLLPSIDRSRLHAAVEVLPTSISLFSAVRDGRSSQIPVLHHRGRAPGLVRLDESLAELVRSQRVAADVARLHADGAADLDALVGRGSPSSLPPPSSRRG